MLPIGEKNMYEFKVPKKPGRKPKSIADLKAPAPPAPKKGPRSADDLREMFKKKFPKK
jgi:hypothetical protein